MKQMKIFVKFVSGRYVSLVFDDVSTGLDLKQRLWEQEGLPVELQALTFSGVALADEMPLSAAGERRCQATAVSPLPPHLALLLTRASLLRAPAACRRARRLNRAH